MYLNLHLYFKLLPSFACWIGNSCWNTEGIYKVEKEKVVPVEEKTTTLTITTCTWSYVWEWGLGGGKEGNGKERFLGKFPLFWSFEGWGSWDFQKPSPSSMQFLGSPTLGDFVEKYNLITHWPSTPFLITCLSNHCSFSLITLVWLQRKLSLRKSSPLLSQHMIWMNP